MGQTKSRIEDFRQLQLKSHFSNMEILSFRRQFHIQYPNHLVPKQDFIDLLHIVGIRNEFLEQVIFRIFCQDASQPAERDFLTMEDLIITIGILSRGTREELLRLSFRLYDIDQDGYISRQEVIVVVRAISTLISSLQMNLFNNPEKLIQNIFSVIDKDGDDQISLQEYLQAFLH